MIGSTSLLISSRVVSVAPGSGLSTLLGGYQRRVFERGARDEPAAGPSADDHPDECRRSDPGASPPSTGCGVGAELTLAQEAHRLLNMTKPAPAHSLPELVDVPARTVLAIGGEGRPEGAAFQAAVAVFDGLGGHRPLEGAYWSGEDQLTFNLASPDGWRWVLAVEVESGPMGPIEGVRREIREAERAARLVHRGPYEEEGPSLAALYAFIASQGLEPAGPHTEVYLTDPRVVAAAALRTELRVAVR